MEIQPATIENFKSYLGNSNLKRKGVDISWTPELVAEYLKCANDPIYFIETYVKIVHVDHGLVPFKLYDYQHGMIRSMADNRYTIITTGRQSGKSTTTVAFILWFVLFHSDKTVALLANKGETAREILGRIQLAFEHLPKWLQQGVVEWNKGSVELENNSRIIAAATSASAIRGYSISLLFIDEAAHIENWDEFFTSVFPTVSSGQTTKVILVSTPYGLNHFYKLWVGAEEGTNGYNPIRVTWDMVPGRDEKWKAETLAAMGGDVEKFNQEHSCQYLGSSGTLIASWKLKELVATVPNQTSDSTIVFEQPCDKRSYVIVADVSRGKGLDYSAAQVIDVTEMPYKQVARFRDNMIVPADYASVLFHLAKKYNQASVLVEINDIGQQVCDILYNDFEYEGVLSTENAGRSGKRVSTGFGTATERGVRTTKSVKSIGCSMLKLLIEQNQLIIRDAETINELMVFSRRRNSYEAESGNNDDLVMGLVLFSWLSDQRYFKELTDINTIMQLREQTEDQISSQFDGIIIINDGENTIDTGDPYSEPDNAWLL